MIEIPLLKRKLVVAYALIDDEDADLVSPYRWGLHSKGYAVSWRDGRNLLLHRLLMGLEFGDPTQVDHRDQSKLDCRRANMRIATAGQNRQNQPVRAGQHRGVSWDKRNQRWKAQARLNGTNHSVGNFGTEKEAAEAVSRWRTEHMPYATEVPV